DRGQPRRRPRWLRRSAAAGARARGDGGPQGAAEIIFKKEINSADDKEAKLKEKTDEFTEKFANPYLAAERGFIDDVIEPKDTRKKLIYYFDILETKVDSNPRKKHGNIPL
ncbi:MAG: hypothetical protein KC684_10635, partial [Candidatus Omnitrophica bacterium]|nr:hypothetical protein [Candidatus Omnitrophota bacterium]